MEICVKNYQDMGFLVMALRPKRVGNNNVKEITNLYLHLGTDKEVKQLVY